MSKPTAKSDSLRRALIGRHTALISRFATVEAISQRKLLRGAVAKKQQDVDLTPARSTNLLTSRRNPCVQRSAGGVIAIVVRKLCANPSAGKIHTQSKSKEHSP
jgi:hypothetical protein